MLERRIGVDEMLTDIGNASIEEVVVFHLKMFVGFDEAVHSLQLDSTSVRCNSWDKTVL
jgi:hypothetical protein